MPIDIPFSVIPDLFNSHPLSKFGDHKLAATDSKQILDKIANGQVSVNGNRAQPNPARVSKKVDAQKSGSAVQTDDQAHVITSEANVSTPAVKVATFPFNAKINKYGFLGFSKAELRALGLTTSDAGKGKLAGDVPIELCAFNSATRELTVKIL